MQQMNQAQVQHMMTQLTDLRTEVQTLKDEKSVLEQVAQDAVKELEAIKAKKKPGRKPKTEETCTDNDQ
ncbi:MAG: hypothetical protein GY775_07305 [Candidatus Scalindua sp.]|nr:hypothetical protein [Candidatus Scalindua sp.]